MKPFRKFSIRTFLIFAILGTTWGCKKQNTSMGTNPLSTTQRTAFLSSLNSLGRMEKVANIMSSSNTTAKSTSSRDESTESAKEQDLATALINSGCQLQMQEATNLKYIQINETKTCLINTAMKHEIVQASDPSVDSDTEQENIDADLTLDDPRLGAQNDIVNLSFHGKALANYVNTVDKVIYTKNGDISGTAGSVSFGVIQIKIHYSGTETFAGANSSGGIQSDLYVQYSNFTAHLKKLELVSYSNGGVALNKSYFLNDTSISQSEFADYTSRLGLLAGDFAEAPSTNP